MLTHYGELVTYWTLHELRQGTADLLSKFSVNYVHITYKSRYKHGYFYAQFYMLVL